MPLKAAATLVVALSLLAIPRGATHAERTPHPAAPFCRVYLDPHDKFTRVVPPETMLALRADAVLSSITVNYSSGFTAPARTAFQAAVDIWKTQVRSNVPIVIDADYRDLGDSLLLGDAGSQSLRDFSGATRPSTWFPFPLADKLAGMDLGAQFGSTTGHIAAEFNSVPRSPWYFGTDGFTPSGQVDFESVVLHELGHGLGFFAQANVSAGVGTIGSGGLPYIYDVSVVDAAGISILNSTAYPNNSTALGTLLTSGGSAGSQSSGIFWAGANGVSANNGVRPKLYAPASFEPGSTYTHLDEAAFPPGDINSLMTPQFGTAEAIHTPGPIVIGTFADMGWGLNTGSQCSFGIDISSETVPAAGGPVNVTLSTTSGCAWTASTTAPFVTITSGTSGSASGIVRMAVAANGSGPARTATVTIGGNTFTIMQLGTGPSMSLDRTSLNFSGVTNGATFVSQTGPQAVRLTQAGAGTVTWTAVSDQPWLVVSPATGSGSATLNVSAQFVNGLAASQTGSITLTFNGAGNFAGPVTVTLSTIQNGLSTAPVGSFDTPTDGSTGVAGSIGVTGWALDDVQVTGLTICRDAVSGESAPIDGRCNGLAKIFIGNAVFIDGARPDVQAQFPNTPLNTRAGWGYLMLTNFLPSLGNGTFTLYAYASDADGHTTLLGTKTITCANNASPAPFGAIDTPNQGEVIGGTAYNNFGWALSPGSSRADVPGGGVVQVQIDGVNRGTPGGWVARSDLTALFPVANYSGVNNAAAVFTFDTTTLANGVHTIAWIVTATAGGTSGIGSRFFTVSNGSLLLDPGSVQSAPNAIPALGRLDMPRMAALRIAGPRRLAAEIDASPADFTAVRGRRGFDPDRPLRDYRAVGGVVAVQAEELDRVELHLSGSAGHRYTGYLRTPDGVAPLPIGSTLDASTGSFGWMPGPGFVGTYNLVFVRWSGGTAVARHEVQVVLNPKGSNRVGTQTIIDLPAGASAEAGLPAEAGSYRTDSAASATDSVASAFRRKEVLVAGWAADLDSPDDRGVDAVHVWAYPVVDGQHGDPIFLGAADYGGARPDVAAIYGDRFRDTGYGILVPDLAPGTYDIAVFAYSTVAQAFAPAKVVRVTVR